jgi:Lar family restriction alleviation protein
MSLEHLSNEELLPCPFCGGNAVLFDDNGPFLVECETCRAASGRSPYPNKAIAAWNSRAMRPDWRDAEKEKPTIGKTVIVYGSERIALAFLYKNIMGIWAWREVSTNPLVSSSLCEEMIITHWMPIPPAPTSTEDAG